MDDTLSTGERKALWDMLLSNWDVFAPTLTKPGQAKHKPHRIDMEGRRPFKCAL